MEKQTVVVSFHGFPNLLFKAWSFSGSRNEGIEISVRFLIPEEGVNNIKNLVHCFAPVA